MSEISKEELTSRIADIIKNFDGDLYTLSSKKIRLQLEKDLGYSLLSQKFEINEISTSEIQKIHKDEESEAKSSSSSSEEEVEKPKRARACAPARKAPVKRKRKAANDSDSGNDNDEDYKSKKTAKKSGPKKGTGFTRPYTLSPQLSAIMGAESLPRHEVVKKIWAIIKERNLYDPKNKQFAICDEQLLPVMKIKRFRTFGMLKYLKPHFLD